MVIRSHEFKEEGFSVEHSGTLITVFSAPNYCGQGGNKGAGFLLINWWRKIWGLDIWKTGMGAANYM